MEEKKSLVKQLQEVQTELKAPKSQFNSFGKYHYRSQEDILEAVKPILAKHGLALTLSDEISVIGSRVYVKATATLFGEDGQTFKVEAFAREPDQKKGRDESQITGTASSYARKYALNGLFAIDDTEDSDSGKTVTIEPKAVPVPLYVDPKDRGDSRITVPLAGKPVPCTNQNIKVETMTEAKLLRIDLNKVATYLKKRPEEVTEEERQKCIRRKKKAREAKK